MEESAEEYPAEGEEEKKRRQEDDAEQRIGKEKKRRGDRKGKGKLEKEGSG